MPEKKYKKLRRLDLRMNRKLFKKMSCIAEFNGLSLNEQVEYWLSEYLSDYEKKHGAIEYENKNE